MNETLEITVGEFGKKKKTFHPKKDKVLWICAYTSAIVVASLAVFLIVLVIKKAKREVPALSYLYRTMGSKEEWKALRRKYSLSGKNVKAVTKSILVLIPSYRDPELCITLNDAWNQALNKNRIIFSICQQNNIEENEAECFAKNSIVLKNKMFIDSISFKDAKGPTYARFRCQSGYRGEDYVLFCDSHIRFEPGWDCLVMDQMLSLPHPEKSIITSYPAGFTREKDASGKVVYNIPNRRIKVTHQHRNFQQDLKLPHFENIAGGSIVNTDKLQLTAFLAAGNFIAPGSMIEVAPFSPETNFLFFREEFFQLARLWTNGYNVYEPAYSYLYHLWSRDYRKTFWENPDRVKGKKMAIQHVHKILDNRVIGKYALGGERTYEQFCDYVGVDPDKMITTRSQKPWTRPKWFSDE